nr:urotensin I [Catostomus commersonii]
PPISIDLTFHLLRMIEMNRILNER